MNPLEFLGLLLIAAICAAILLWGIRDWWRSR